MVALRQYQLDAIARIRAAAARTHAVLCVSPTGSGKTTIASEIVRRAVDRGHRALWLAHRSELVGQAYDRLRQFGLSVGTVSASTTPDRPPNPFAPVQVASIQTLIARKLRPEAQVVIWDECFVAGTLITLASGEQRPIERIAQGDQVMAYDERNMRFEPRHVLATMRRQPTQLVMVEIGTKKIVCTPNHPFWTTDGWKTAGDLVGRYVLVRLGPRTHETRRVSRAEAVAHPEMRGSVYNLEVDGLHTYLANGVVVHNCHHSPSDLWSSVAADYSASRIVGFTATPERSDGRGLGNIFGELVVAASVRQLVDLGHLVPCEIVAPRQRLRAGSIAQRPVDAYLKHARGRHAVCFSPSIVAAQSHVEEFRSAGIAAELVHSKLGFGERAAALEAFRSRRVNVLVNVNVLTEGFDVPETDCVILARGCGTAGTYIQMIGRGLRPATGKSNCLLLDLHGVSHVHGSPEDDRQYALDGKGIRSANDLEVDDQSSCRVCGAPIESGEACSECGTEPKQIKPPSVTGEELVRYAAKRAEPDDKRIATLARWIADGRSKGFKPGWATAKFKAVYGSWPSSRIVDAANAMLAERAA